MKKIYTLLLSTMALGITAQADNYLVSFAGISYDQPVLNVVIGDVVTIQASPTHPLRQVSQATWDVNGSTQLSGGFGTETTDYTFAITSLDEIYYVCAAHVAAGMKGKIVVSAATGIQGAAAVTSLMVYPNPVTHGSVTVKAAEQLDGQTMEFYNSSGQLVKAVALSGLQTEINVRLANGVYSAVLLKDDKAIARKRLVFINR